MGQLGLALLQYAADHDDRLPPAQTWHRSILAYVNEDTSLLTCPTRKRGGALTYALPDCWHGATMEAVAGSSRDGPMDAILVYEVDGGQIAFPHRTYARNLWEYPRWRRQRPGLERPLDRYMWVVYGDAHWAAKNDITPEMIATGRDPHPF